MRLRSLGTLGSIRTVPFTATVFCNVVDVALVQHAIISQLEAHAQCRTTRDRTFACASEGIHALSRGYNALCSEKILGAVVFPGKIVLLRSTRVHTTMQVPAWPVEDGRHGLRSAILHRRHRTADGRHVPRLRPWSPLSPTGQDVSCTTTQLACCHV
jgi:hypothetical protein